MRRTSWLFTLVLCTTFAGAAGLAGCGSSRPISVVRLGPGETKEPVSGDAVKIKRGSQETFVGLRGGFYVVRNAEDWRNAWPTGNEPPLPQTLDTSSSMLILAAAEQKETSEIKIDKVIENAEAIHVFVRNLTVGKNCPTKQEQRPFDAVTTPRIDKPVKFYVQENQADSCGDAPAVTIKCRLNDGAAWLPNITAQPGDKVECEMGAEPRGKFALVDNVLSLGALPGGSSAKLAYTRSSARGAFTLDVFGAYTVRAESTDEAGRKTLVVANVEAVPPKTRDVLVQLVWSNVDPGDDPATFPRVKLRAFEESRDAKNKPISSECSADAPKPELCEVKIRGANVNMKLKASDKKIPLDVLYRDERFEKGPLVCIQVYFDGKRTAETCDRKQRAAEERWTMGVLEMDTGKLLDAPPPSAAPPVEEKKPAPAKPAAKPPAKK
jgi:hypothetical protein